jgi:hypothetical protein
MPEAKSFLKLAAFDTDDLEIISTHMQDAVLTVASIKYLPRQQKLALVANRFGWEDAERHGLEPYRRRLTGLQFARVKSVRCRNIRQESKDNPMMLLSIRFEPGDPPEGEVVLTFSGGGDLKLEVECLEAVLEDLGPEWITATKPVHDTSEAN